MRYLRVALCVLTAMMVCQVRVPVATAAPQDFLIYVDPNNGSDATGDGTFTNPVQSLSSASGIATKSPPFPTIAIVSSGNVGTATFNVPVRIESLPGITAIASGSGSTDSAVLTFTSSASGSVVTGLNVDCAGTVSTGIIASGRFDYIGIGRSVRVERCITGLSFTGLSFGSDLATTSLVEFRRNQTGLQVNGGFGRFYVGTSRFYNNSGAGIAVGNGQGKVVDSLFVENGTGVALTISGSVSLDRDHFVSNQIGVSSCGAPCKISHSANNFSGNQIHSQGAGNFSYGNNTADPDSNNTLTIGPQIQMK